MKIGKFFETFCPISGRFLLALQCAGGFASKLSDIRRGHFEIVGVVRENGRQIMGIPVADPIFCELLGKRFIDHSHLRKFVLLSLLRAGEIRLAVAHLVSTVHLDLDGAKSIGGTAWIRVVAKPVLRAQFAVDAVKN